MRTIGCRQLQARSKRSETSYLHPKEAEKKLRWKERRIQIFRHIQATETSLTSLSSKLPSFE